MREMIIGIVFSLASGTTVVGQCTPTSTQDTKWGGNTNVVMREARLTNRIHGIVENQVGQPLNGVLVEIYDHPEIVLQEPSPDRTGQKRIAACVAGDGGLFSFDVPPGSYELRFSKSSEWNVTSVPVRVTKSGHSSKKDLVVRLSRGQ